MPTDDPTIPSHYDIAEAMTGALEEPEAVAIMHALLAIGDSLRTLTTIALADGVSDILQRATSEWDPPFENGATEFATGTHDRHLARPVIG